MANKTCKNKSLHWNTDTVQTNKKIKVAPLHERICLKLEIENKGLHVIERHERNSEKQRKRVNERNAGQY